MPRFRCIRKCYNVDRLYKVDDFYEGEAAPSRHFEGYVDKKPLAVANANDNKQAPAQGRGK